MTADELDQLLAEANRREDPDPFVWFVDLDRLRKEVAAQDGDDPDADDLTDEQWAKVKASGSAGYGSPVQVTFVQDEGFEDTEPITDHGYLTQIPGQSGDWDMIGIVHIPRPWVEKERPIPEWHSLYSLCRNDRVAEIRIGEICGKPPKGWQCSRERGHKGPCAASPE